MGNRVRARERERTKRDRERVRERERERRIGKRADRCGRGWVNPATCLANRAYVVQPVRRAYATPAFSQLATMSSSFTVGLEYDFTASG
jgi:hypothetical protein